MNRIYPPEFIRNHFKLNNKFNNNANFDLYDYQEDLINKINIEHYVLVHHARLLGISNVMYATMLWHAIYKNGFGGMIYVPRNKDAIRIHGDLVSMYNSCKHPTPPIVSITDNKILFSNGSLINIQVFDRFIPVAIQLMNTKFIWIDGSNFIHDAAYLFNGLLPVVNHTKIVVTDSVISSNSPTHTVWQSSKPGGFLKIKLPYTMSTVHKDHNKFKADMIAKIGKFQFEIEYENKIV